MAGESRTGGRILVDPLQLHGVDTVFCVPGESYLASSTRCTTRPRSASSSAARKAARPYGRGLRQADRPAGHRLRHPRPGRHQRQRRRAYRPAGLDADDPVRRPGRPRQPRPRGLPGGRLPPMFGGMAKWAAEIDDPARIPEFVARAFASRPRAGPGPVVLALPEDMLNETRRRAPTAGRYAAGRGRARAGRSMAELRGLLATRRAAAGDAGRRRLERQARAPTSRASPRPTTCRSACRLPPPGPARQRAIRCYAGDVGIGLNPKLAERIKDADL